MSPLLGVLMRLRGSFGKERRDRDLAEEYVSARRARRVDPMAALRYE